MQRPSVNYVIDLLSLLVLLGIAATGLLMKFVLPPGSGGRGLVLWGLGRHDWGSVHFWLTVSMAALVAVHLFLHWSWICTLTARLTHPSARVPPPTPGVRRLMGAGFVAGLVVLLGGFTLVARYAVQTDEASIESHEGGRGAGEPLRAGRNRAP